MKPRGPGLRSAPDRRVVCAAAIALWGVQAVDVAGGPQAALRRILNASADDPLVEFYRERRFHPLWFQGGRVRPDTFQVLSTLEAADQDGLDPGKYRVTDAREAIRTAETGEPAKTARADILISRAFAAYVEDLRNPFVGVQWVVADLRLAFSPATVKSALSEVAGARSLTEHLIALRRMNPVYEALRRGLQNYRARWSNLPDVAVPDGSSLTRGSSGERVRLLRGRLGLDAATGPYDDALAASVRRFQEAHGLPVNGVVGPATIEALNAGPGRYERVILANLERARALPLSLGRRYVLVDTAAGRLTMYADERVVGTMRVIVGEASKPTPAMAGMISHAVFHPYWNVPEDLVRERVAPRVLRRGSEALRAMQMEVLSDWSASARRIDPRNIDWLAVAAGRSVARIRQLPGPDNMLGGVKFVFPNNFDVYLHDTPNRRAFMQETRTLSAGCVRVERAEKLAAFLLRTSEVPDPLAATEERVDLPAPVPIYLVYLTANVDDDGALRFRPDVYGRDPALIARLALDRG